MKNEDNFIDLNEVVKNWAKTQYNKTANRREKKLRNKEDRNPGSYIGINIDWTEVKFQDSTDWPELSLSEKNSRSASVLFESKYTNSSGQDQEYTMRTEKTTRSTMETSVEKGFTRGFDLSIKLQTPCQVLEANAGYRQENSLTDTSGETFEEELVWGCDSQIKVQKDSIADATLVVEEVHRTGQFVIKTLIKGFVYVSFTNIRDNNSLIKSTGYYISEIVKEFVEQSRRIGKPYSNVKVNDEDMSVEIETSGTCQFNYGIRQQIEVKQKAISDL